MEKPKGSKLGQLLVKNKMITEEQLEDALEEQGRSGKALGRILVEMGAISEGQLTAVVAEQIGTEYVDLGSYPVDPAAANMIDKAVATRYTMIPVDFRDGKLIVAMADPTNVFALDDLHAVTGMDVIAVVSTPVDIKKAIDLYMNSLSPVDQEQAAEEEIVLPDPEELLPEEIEEEFREEEAEDAPIVRYVNLVLAEAVRDNASDVHIEPREKDLRIRFRVDGVLHEVRKSSKRVHPGIISRIKILSNMNIAERRVPQDGRFNMTVGGKNVDFRVASLPTVHGEKIVLRILDRSTLLMNLEDLGMEPEPLEQFKKAFKKPYGAVIVTGPTGSGKTTTLYAALAELNRREVNIITVEDPVEYQLKGVNQVQVNTKVGLTFARTLRSILRCDPDIVMVGEIRDPESAKMAIESALTGHMVLCTLHTNDAPSAMTRMIEMGVEPFLIASAVDAVVSQRLARKLCRRCRQEAEYDVKYLKKIGFPEVEGDKIKIYRAKPDGCVFCGRTGYRGRVGLFEVLMVDEDIEKLVVNMATAHEIGRLARQKGMKTHREDGFIKVLRGITSIEEVLRVVM